MSSRIRLLSPASRTGRRRALSLAALAALVVLVSAVAAPAQGRRAVVAVANLTEEPGVTLEGTGFTGADVRQSFTLAARGYPIDLVFYDNARDDRRALANAGDAVARRVDLYVQYHRDAAANAAVAERLKAAGVPVLALNYPVPGAPLYTADNEAAGRIAGETLGSFASRAWRGQPTVAVVIGALDAPTDRVPERARGVIDGLRRTLPGVRPAALDTHGNPGQVAALLGRVLAANASAKILVAALDDATALASKGALETAGRLADAAIVGHGADRSVHGGINDRKEIDPNNRGSVVLGSVAFYVDRYGHEVLPLVMRMLRGEPVPPRTVTPHRLISAANVWIEYPPSDMN